MKNNLEEQRQTEKPESLEYIGNRSINQQNGRRGQEKKTSQER